MRNSLRLVLALGGASVLATAFLLACSDDTQVSVDPTEAGSEAGKTDSPSGDAGADTAAFDGGFAVATFDDVLATELCKSLARCCYGTPTPAEGGVDGGSFDQAGCVANLGAFGFQGSNLGTAKLRDAGNVVLDQVSADDCINKVKALKCDLPGTDYTAARAACFGAYSGKIAAGQACNGAVECQAGLFCKGQVDGGAGVCTAIRPLGGACGDNPNNPTEYEEACSYRGSGGSGVYCKYYDFADGGDLDAGDWKCTAAEGADAGCFASTWCKDTICKEDTFVCATPDRLFDSACNRFVK